MSFPVTTLTGRWVRLEPLAEAHREPLRLAADDEPIWRVTTMVARGPGFDRLFDEALSPPVGRHADSIRGSPSRRRRTGRQHELPGCAPRHQRVEIGWTWYRPGRVGHSREPGMQAALLTNAFECSASIACPW